MSSIKEFRTIQHYNEREQRIMKAELKEFEAQCEKLEAKYGVKCHHNQDSTASLVIDKLENRKTLNVLVVGKTQSGKTGVIFSIIKKAVSSLNVPIENIYVITGLSDVDWQSQTKSRLPALIKDQVYHRGNMKKFKESIQVKDDNDKVIGIKKNILIIIDEIHVACMKDNTLYNTFKEIGLNDKAMFFSHDVKFVQFSATPDGNVYDIEQWKHNSAIVKHQPGSRYTSSFDLYKQDRVFQYKRLSTEYEDEEEEIMDNIKQVKKVIKEHYIDRYYPNLYHVIRTREGDMNCETLSNFKQVFGDKYAYIKYDQSSTITDINDILKVSPNKHTFIFIKEKLRCAKTLVKDHIGVCYERYTERPNDSTIIQGLVGRLTGYDDNNISICFTNVDTVVRYEEMWCQDFNADVEWRSNSTRYSKYLAKSVSKNTYNSPKYNNIEYEDEESIKEKDKKFKIFEDQDDAIDYIKTELGLKAKRRSSDIAPDELMVDGDNPTVEYLTKRMWGLSKKVKFRMVPTNTNKWCVYWRPSLLVSDE